MPAVAAAVLIAGFTPPLVAEAEEPALVVAAPEAPTGPGLPEVTTPRSEPPADPITESWTPTTHAVTKDGETTLALYSQPAFRRSAAGWTKVDPAITAGTGDYPFEALGLINPVHFGATADALVTIDTLAGPVVMGLDGATVGLPTLKDGVLTYAGVFPGVDLLLNTAGGRLSKQLVLANQDVQQSFHFTLADPHHTLGQPSEGANESWTFPTATAFGTGLELPAPAAWTQEADVSAALPGSAHQRVVSNAAGYGVDLSLDPLWAQDAAFPVVLDPAIQWTDDAWYDDDGLAVGFGPTSETGCDGGPCALADPVDDRVLVGYLPSRDPAGEYLAYAGADLSALEGRQVASAVLGGWMYSAKPLVWDVCEPIDAESTGADLAAGRCGEARVAGTMSGSLGGDGWFTGQGWRADVTTTVRAAVRGTGPTGHMAGFAVGHDDYITSYWDGSQWHDTRHRAGNELDTPQLHMVYTGYPVPRPLTTEQTFGCACWAGKSSANQALAGDPVNTATGALLESFGDLSVASVGQPIEVTRTYNSLDTATGPFGPGWSYAYGASLREVESGQFTFRDGTGTQTRYAAMLGGGYAPLDPAVSAVLTDGIDGTRVLRNLSGATMTFDATGALIAAADERGQGVTMAYTAGKLATVTDALGQTATVAWDAGTGTNARIASVTASDGRVVSYTHATTAGAKRLTAVTGIDGKITKYAYDTVTGGLSKITDPLSHVRARNTYDPVTKRITKQLDQTGAETTFAWDAETQTATITDPTGRTRQDIYNGLNLVKQIDGQGNVTQTFYDGDNNVAASVDGADSLFTSQYDDRDRLISRTAPAPLYYTERWTYDDADRVTSYTDQAGVPTQYTYDADGLLTTQTFVDGTTVTYTYTTGEEGVPAHLLATSTDQLGRTTTNAYDAAGNLVSTTTPGGRTTSHTYDASHRPLTVTDPMGNVTTTTYDVNGRVLTTTDALGAVTTNIYDAAGRLTRTTNPLNRSVSYTYDAADRVVQTKHSSGRTTKTSYDAAGRVATTTGPLGAVTSYAYDPAGRLISTTDPLGHTSTSTYDDAGKLVSQTDATGAVTTFGYDVLGRQTKVTDPDGVTQATIYDARGAVLATQNSLGGGQSFNYDWAGRQEYAGDSDGVQTRSEYDGAGQLVATTKPRSTDNYIPNYWEDRTTYTYDADGLLTSTVDPRGHVPYANPAEFTSTVSYDANGRPTLSTDPLGRAVSTTYDAVGRPLIVTDPAGNVTTTAYDKIGQITQVTGPAGAITKYAYNAYGNLTQVTDPRSRVTKYSYDVAGNTLTSTDPLGRVTAMTYDAAGRLATTTKPSGTATTTVADDSMLSYTYDGAGRLADVDYSDATPDMSYTYTSAGRPDVLTRAADALGAASIDYTYDTAGRPAAVDRTGPRPTTAAYTYTPAGRVTGASWSTGQGVAYAYNTVGQMTTITPSGTATLPAITLGYDAAGHTTTVTRAGATPTVSTSTYDAAGQLTALNHTAGTEVIADYQLARDPRGFPTQVTSTLLSPPAGVPATTTNLYAYHANGWLTSECTPATGTTCTSTSPKTTYTYDSAGVRKTTAVTRLSGTAPQTTTTAYAYDRADQLLTLKVGSTTKTTNTWTTDGQIATTTTSAGTRTYNTNLAGEVDTVTLEDTSTIGYSYDPTGNRTARTTNNAIDTTWAWDDLTGLSMRIGEYGATGAPTTTWLPDPTSSTGASYAATAAGTSSWLLQDPYANTIATLPTTGDITGARTQAVDAFGNPLTTATPVGPIGFAGQHNDSTTGLYDVRARDYDTRTGQFLSIDPLVDDTRQPYTYGNNNPLVYIDPTGLISRPWDDLDVLPRDVGWTSVTTRSD